MECKENGSFIASDLYEFSESNGERGRRLFVQFVIHDEMIMGKYLDFADDITHGYGPGFLGIGVICPRIGDIVS
jgi:hypothetical protein